MACRQRQQISLPVGQAFHPWLTSSFPCTFLQTIGLLTFNSGVLGFLPSYRRTGLWTSITLAPEGSDWVIYICLLTSLTQVSATCSHGDLTPTLTSCSSPPRTPARNTILFR